MKTAATATPKAPQPEKLTTRVSPPGPPPANSPSPTSAISSPRWGVTPPPSSVTDGECSGFGCCQASLTEGLRSNNINLTNFNNLSMVRDFDPCSFAFLVDKDSYFFNKSDFVGLQKLDQVSRMGTISKKLKREQPSKVDSEDEYQSDEDLNTAVSGEDDDSLSEYGDDASDDNKDEEEEEEDDEDVEEEDYAQQNDGELEELEKEYKDLQNMEQNLVQNLKRHKDEDLLKGKAMRNQKALWDKNLECRIILQKAFSKSNRLPQEPSRSSFCEFDEGVRVAYVDLIESSKRTIDSFLELQEALLEKNPSIIQTEGNSGSSLKPPVVSNDEDLETDEEWLKISQMQRRIATFRNKSVDKWHRKNEVSTGVAVKKKLHAFNQNISDQVATYMRDPNKMIKSMQMRRETVGVFGSVPSLTDETKEEATANAEGDPELLEDTEFYQQLFKEFFETIDPNSSEAAFYAIKRMRTKKRKVVDRRASKSRKIRYNVHEKIVNFMAPQPLDLPPMASKLFENLFGLRTSNPAA